jgi:exodeoxyribonuclease VII large subunit
MKQDKIMNTQDTRAETILTVSELVHLIQFMLDRSIPTTVFQGEVSEITRAASGHIYLTLKDEKSQIAGVMWKGTARTLVAPISRGDLVECHGKPTVYPASGRLQVIISHMSLAGEGALQKRFLELKASLEREGLFAPERKRPLPYLPRAIGIVTSKTGAVIHDMMVKLRERMPQIPVYLVDIRVQGEGASQEIAAAIEYLSVSDRVDVIIVARGGGSLEDLWAFNEEPVVRAIFASRVPVISGVGHEVDYTLSDFVADVRAPTPTAAAEYVVPKRDELLRRLAELEQRLSPSEHLFHALAQRLDELDLSLMRRVATQVERRSLLLNQQLGALQRIQPHALIERLRTKLALATERSTSAILRVVDRARNRLDRAEGRLEALSPTRVLERGFAIVERDGLVLRDSESLTKNDTVSVRLHSGRFRATVDEVG